LRVCPAISVRLTDIVPVYFAVLCESLTSCVLKERKGKGGEVRRKVTPGFGSGDSILSAR
jgi:hypothetical protein